MRLTHPPCLPNRESDGNDGSDGNNECKFPVPLQRPEYYSVSLEQEEWIESLTILKANMEFMGLRRISTSCIMRWRTGGTLIFMMFSPKVYKLECEEAGGPNRNKLTRILSFTSEGFSPCILWKSVWLRLWSMLFSFLNICIFSSQMYLFFLLMK